MNLSPSKKAVLLLFFTLSAGCLYYLLVSGIDYAVDPVSLLPGNTAVLIDVKRPVDNINRFRKSKLGIQVTSIQWEEVLRESGVREENIREFLNLTGEIETIVKSPVFNELFANRVVLGIMPADSANIEGSEVKTGIEQMMVLVARPRHRASLVDIFVGFFLDELNYTVESYKGRQIKTFAYDTRHRFSTTVTDGLFIASFSPHLVKQCIDNSINNMISVYSGLKGNNSYLQLKQRARGRDDQFVYIDIPNLLTIVENNEHAEGNSLPGGYGPGPFYPQRVALFRQSGKKIRNYSSIVQYGPGTEQEEDGRMFEKYKPDRDAILPLLPDNNVVHLWTNIFNAGQLWNFLRSGQNGYAQALAGNIEEWLGEKTEYSVGEFLSFFGNQLSVNIAEMKSSGIIPMPRISLYVEVHDREKVHNLLDRLFADLQVRHSLLGGRDVYSIFLAGGLMQPSFMFLDNFLVVADGRQQLENLLSGQKKSLLASPLFKKVDVGLTEENNFVLYFRNAELIDGIKELVRWYGSLLQLFDSESRVKNRIIIEKIVLPLLEGMKMYKVKTVRAYARGTETVMRSSQLLEND